MNLKSEETIKKTLNIVNESIDTYYVSYIKENKSTSNLAKSQNIIKVNDNINVITHLGSIDFNYNILKNEAYLRYYESANMPYAKYENLSNSDFIIKRDLNNTNEKINQISRNILLIETGNYNFPKITLNGNTITEWPSGGASISSQVANDSNINPRLGINPSLIQIEENLNNINQNRLDIYTFKEGNYDFPKLILNGDPITEWPSGGASISSQVANDANINPRLGINPSLIQIEENLNNINQNRLDIYTFKEGNYDFPKLILNGNTITEWPSGGASISSQVANDANMNPTLGINPSLIQIQQNKDNISINTLNICKNALDIKDIKSGEVNYPKLILNGDAITEWPSGGASISSQVANDANMNPTLGINPYLIQIQQNKDNISINTLNITQNTSDIENIKSGDFDFTKLTLNGDAITSWPSGEDGGVSTSSDLTDDSDTNPNEGINPWKTQIDENTNDIANIINGTIPVNSLSSLTTDDSATNPLQGINPWKTQINQNTDALENNTAEMIPIKNGTYDYPQLILNGVPITEWPSGNVSLSSKLIDDSENNPNKGINKILKQIKNNTTSLTTKANKLDLRNLQNQINNLMLPIGTIIISPTAPLYGLWKNLGNKKENCNCNNKLRLSNINNNLLKIKNENYYWKRIK